MEHKDYKDIYIGQLIQKKVDESQMSYTEFARQIHVARTSLYRIFESKSIDVERLLLISEVLDYDFIHKVYIGGKKKRQLEHTFLCLYTRDTCILTIYLLP